MRTKLFALYAAVAMVFVAVGPGIAAAAAAGAGNAPGNAPLEVAINQATDDGSVTVDVTRDETGVGDANVSVEANETYAGEGDYTTDDGIVGLPAPEENVTIDVTAEAHDRTASATANLTAVEEFVEQEPFGQLVSSFVRTLIDSDVDRVGPYVASFAVENNPGNAPDNAGPPGFLTGEEDGGDRGPPEDAGPPEDEGDEEDEESEDSEGGDDSEGGGDDGDRGPPGDTGNGNGDGPPS